MMAKESVYTIWDEESYPIDISADSIEEAVLDWIDAEENGSARSDLIANGFDIFIKSHGIVLKYHVEVVMTVEV